MSLIDNYIKEIINLLPHADAELLDFVFQLLKKSTEKPINPSETCPRSA